MKLSAFPELEGLVHLSRQDGLDIRPTLLRVLTDLYVQKHSHSAEEEAQYIELAQRLIDAVDSTTRATVAARLAAYPAAPRIVLDKLAAAIGNLPAPPQTPAEPESDLIGLFFDANTEERRLILTNLDAAAPADHPTPVSPAPETCRRLESLALERNQIEFSRILETALSLAPGLGQRIVADPGGEPLLVVAKALGMSGPTVQRLLLFINPVIGQSVQQVYELANLYEELSAQIAVTLIESWRARTAPKRAGAYRSVYWDDERRSARSAATTAHHRTVRRSGELAARFKSSGR